MIDVNGLRLITSDGPTFESFRYLWNFAVFVADNYSRDYYFILIDEALKLSEDITTWIENEIR